ncbi:MAG: glycoside hydrolase family 36 protein [Anaerolineae bacterium]
MMETISSGSSRFALDSWLARHLRAGGSPPFSLVYGGEPLDVLLAQARATYREQPPAKGDGTELTFHLELAPSLDVRLEAQVYPAFEAVEWMLVLTNTGNEDSPVIEALQALDTTLERGDQGEFLLHRLLGSDCKPTDFAPLEQTLGPGAEAFFAPEQGFSSNVSAFPFFGLAAPEGGVMVAIGWTGQWAARLTRDAAAGLRLQAGMEGVRISLRPGESIRSPRILLVFYQGERLAGHNRMRRFLAEHHTPLIEGRPMLPLVSCNTWFPSGDDGNLANETNQLEIIQAYADLGIEYIVVDAGWSVGGYPKGCGDWRVDPTKYPRGLKPLADAAHACGIKFGLWMPPELVMPGTPLDQEHPEWLLKLPGNNHWGWRNHVLNLGVPEAWQWLLDTASALITEVGIDYYRFDGGVGLDYLHAYDTPYRQGITEIRHIEGLYAYADALRSRFPHVMFEGCSGGGRRIDLEMVSRCNLFWKTDYYFDSEANQAHALGGNLYLPTYAWNTPFWSLSDYDLRSCLGGSLCLGWDPRQEGFPQERAQAMVAQFKRLRPLMQGDFYPLLEHSLRPDATTGYQYHRSDLDEGMCVLFRRAKSPYVTLQVPLRGLTPERLYRIVDEDTGEAHTLSGLEMASTGVRITLERAPSAALLTYRAVR